MFTAASVQQCSSLCRRSSPSPPLLKASSIPNRTSFPKCRVLSCLSLTPQDLLLRHSQGTLRASTKRRQVQVGAHRVRVPRPPRASERDEQTKDKEGDSASGASQGNRGPEDPKGIPKTIDIEDIEKEAGQLFNELGEALDATDDVRVVVYKVLSILGKIELSLDFLRDEDGIPASQAVPPGKTVAKVFADLGFEPGVNSDIATAVRRSLLDGPESPVTVRTTGNVTEYLDTVIYDLDAGVLFFGELKKEWSSKAAAESLCSKVRTQFPGYRMALLPLPEKAEDIALQFNLDPSRRCAVALFKQFSLLQLNYLCILIGPALLAALFQLKAVAVTIPGVTSDVASVQAAAFFGFAAILPAAAAFMGQAAWSKAYKRPINTEFLPILSPGAGFVTISTRLGQVPDSRTMAMDFALASSLGSLGASVALLKSSSCSLSSNTPLPPLPNLETFGIPEATSVTVPGTVLVPQTFLSHSPFFNQMADRLSCAALPDPKSTTDVLFAMPPLALAGLLGLHLTALCLVPFAASNGGRLVEALVDDDTRVVSFQVLTLLFVVFCMFNTGAPTWIVFYFASLLTIIRLYPLSFRPLKWDSVTPPDFVRTTIGVGLLSGGIFAMLPPPLYNLLADSGLGLAAESLMDLLLPGK